MFRDRCLTIARVYRPYIRLRGHDLAFNREGLRGVAKQDIHITGA